MSEAASPIHPPGDSRGHTLVEIVSQKAVILRKVLENGGELPPALEQQLDDIDLTLAEKIDGYIEFMAQMQAEELYWKAKASQASAVGKTCEKIRDRLKDRVKQLMQASKQTELLGNDMRFSLIPSKDALDLIEGLVPEEYKDAEVVWTVNRDRVIQDLQLGIEIPGAAIREVKQLRTYPVTGGKKKPAKGKKKEGENE